MAAAMRVCVCVYMREESVCIVVFLFFVSNRSEQLRVVLNHICTEKEKNVNHM